MILPGTYANGFAPRDGEPLFPELWRDCVGAWNPGLGPTGTRLYDWSPYRNHGTLTNMDAGTDWVASQGGYALNMRGSQLIDCGNSQASSIYNVTTGNLSVFLWATITASNNDDGLISRGSFGTNGWFLSIGGGASVRAIVLGIGGTLFTTAHRVVLNELGFYGFTKLGADFTIYKSGIGLSANRVFGSAVSQITSSTNPLQIFNDQGEEVRQPEGVFREAYIYNRALSPNEIRLLASRRGIAYEMAPRNWTASQIAAYRARYYSQLVGGGVI
jgi:hypothetical protein